MAKVIALEPFVGSYRCGVGETPDFSQKESRVKGDMGELVSVSVGYRSIRVQLALERAATPGDLQDDAARVARGEKSWVSRNGAVPILLVPGQVTIGGVTIAGKSGENPAFDVPDEVAAEWVGKGLVKIAEDEVKPAATAPTPDPRLVRRRVEPAATAST